MKHSPAYTQRILQCYLYLILIPFAGIITRLCYLQIYEQLHLAGRSVRNYLRYENIISPRGTILDCNGKLLATNRPIIHLVWQGSGNHLLRPHQEADLAMLDTILQISASKKAIEQAERRSRAVTLTESLSFEQLSVLVEKFPDHHNIRFVTTFQRFYPYGSLASHILGHIAQRPQQQGSMGLEKACDTLLSGIPGQLLITVNSHGNQVAQNEIQQAKSGEAIATTINIDMQKIAEMAFPSGTSGVFIAMEAATGALRVVMSRPSFDPNIFTTSIAFEQWEQLIQSKALLNRAFLSCYPPASLFKLVTIIAALDSKLISPSESWYCPGYTTFHGRKYTCMRSHAHGAVTIEDALAKSCNIPFFDIGRRININTLAHYAHLLGLGVGTESIIGEKLGIIPSTQWKLATLHEPWWPGETLSASIGQTFLLIPPIQICRMIGTICEGYTVVPHLVANTPLRRIPTPINSAILSRMKQSMHWVITRGTGVQLSHFNMELFAKTGTAQTRNKTGKSEIDEGAHSHGWFAMHVTYKNEPSLVVVILMEGVESSQEATAVAKRFLKEYKKYIDAQQHTAPMAQS